MAYLYTGIAVLALAVFVALARMYLAPWLKGQLAGYPISMVDLIYVVTHGANTARVTDAYLAVQKTRVNISIHELTDIYRSTPEAFEVEVRRLIERGLRK